MAATEERTLSALGEAALTHAAAGWPVFPVWGVAPNGACACQEGANCPNAGKHPLGRLTRNGLKNATTDPQQIRSWWQQEPTANIGGRTGNGRVVLDVDPRHGGTESLHDLELQHGPLPDTPRSLTGGGGEHLIFHADGLVANKVGIAPGLDVRGDGGYIVLPGSMHVFGNAYRWDAGAHPGDLTEAECPRWLLGLIGGEKGAGTGADGRKVDPARILDGVPEGERNEALFRYASSLRSRGGLSLEEALVLVGIAATNCRAAPDELPGSAPYPREGTAGWVAIVQRVWQKYPDGRSALAKDGQLLDEDDESCAEKPTAIAALRRENAALRRRLSVRDETIASLQLRISQIQALLTHQAQLDRNVALRPAERLIIKATSTCVAEAASHGADPAAPVRIPLARIAEHAGVSERTALRDVKKLEKWGLIAREIHKGEGAPYLYHNRLTGRDEERFGDVSYIALKQPLLETLEAAAILQPERPTHGGARRYVCSECPDADVIHAWQAVCAGCGAVLDEGRYAYANPDAPSNENPSEGRRSCGPADVPCGSAA